MVSRWSSFLLLVLAQILIIFVLVEQAGKDTYRASVSPLYRSDVLIATSSDRFKHYYDLSGENNVFVPDWLPYTPVYERNSDRLNDRYDYERPKPRGHYRILMLGDSWTFGLHVSTALNYSEVLEDSLNHALATGALACDAIQQFDVINLGLGGYDIAYMIESLRLRGMAYEPDLVIPLIKNDDFIVVNELWQPKIAAYQNEYASLEATVVNGVARNPRQEIAERVVNEIHASYDVRDLEDISMREVEMMNTFYNGSLLFFMYGMPESQEKRLTAFAARRAGTYTHRERMLEQHEKVPHDEHPGAVGHARFAAGLYRALTEQGIIPCEVR